MEQSLQLLRDVGSTLYAKDCQLAQQQEYIGNLQEQISALEKKLENAMNHTVSTQIRLLDREKELVALKSRSFEHAETQTDGVFFEHVVHAAPQLGQALMEEGHVEQQLVRFAQKMTDKWQNELTARQAVRGTLEHELQLIAADAWMAHFEVSMVVDMLGRIMPELWVIEAEMRVVSLQLMCVIEAELEKEACICFEQEMSALSKPQPRCESALSEQSELDSIESDEAEATRTLETIEAETVALEDQITTLQAEVEALQAHERRRAAKAAKKLAAQLKAAQEKQAREAKRAKAEVDRRAREDAKRASDAERVLVRDKQMAAKTKAAKHPEKNQIRLPGHETPEARALAVMLAVQLRRSEEKEELSKELESFVCVTKSVFKKRDTSGFKFRDDTPDLAWLLDLHVKESLGVSSGSLEKSTVQGEFRLTFSIRKFGFTAHYESPFVDGAQIVLWLEQDDFVTACESLFGYEEPTDNLSDAACILNHFEDIKGDEAFLRLQLRELDMVDSYGLPLYNITALEPKRTSFTLSMLRMVIWFRMGKIASMASV